MIREAMSREKVAGLARVVLSSRERPMLIARQGLLEQLEPELFQPAQMRDRFIEPPRVAKDFLEKELPWVPTRALT